MTVIIGAIALILIFFLVGLISRRRGDGAIDTLGSGCRSVFVLIIIIIAVIVILIANNVIKF